MHIRPIEKELWEAADQLRANSKLTAAEYSMPVLGLSHDHRFGPDLMRQLSIKVSPPEVEAVFVPA